MHFVHKYVYTNMDATAVPMDHTSNKGEAVTSVCQCGFNHRHCRVPGTTGTAPPTGNTASRRRRRRRNACSSKWHNSCQKRCHLPSWFPHMCKYRHQSYTYRYICTTTITLVVVCGDSGIHTIRIMCRLANLTAPAMNRLWIATLLGLRPGLQITCQ